MSHTRRSISRPMMQRGSPALPWMSLAGESWSEPHAALSAPSSANGELLLWLAHAPERVPTHRRQLLSRSLRGLRERLGDQDWLAQHFAQSLEARRLIHGGADHREVEAVGGAYVAVRDFASVQRNVQAKRRIAGCRLSGVERPDPRQYLARRRQRRRRHDCHVCPVRWQEHGQHAVAQKLEDFAARRAHRIAETVEDAVKAPGYLL